MPDFRVMPDGAIRVLHLDLDKSWWHRGMSLYERDVAEVESIVRQATGLRRITKRHTRYYVELRVRPALVAQAVTAVMMQFGPQSTTTLLGHNA